MLEFLRYVKDIVVQLGGGLLCSQPEFVPNPENTFDDQHVPGVMSLLKHHKLNYRAKTDDSIGHNIQCQ